MSTHTGISTVAFAMALSLAAAGPVPPGLAQVAPAPSQTGQDHDAHHPGANAEVPPAATPAPAPTQTTRSPMAIMGLGGPPGIMGDMRQMMRNTMTMMSSNVEGRIATLKTELKITDAQAPQWDRFADRLRSAAKSMNGMSAQMMETGTMGTS